MILFTSGGGLGTLVEESMGEDGHIMLLLARDLGCNLRAGRTFRTPLYLLRRNSFQRIRRNLLNNLEKIYIFSILNIYELSIYAFLAY